LYEPGVVIREVKEDDLKSIAPLLTRFYRFNEEFDPAWSTKELSEEEIEEILKRRMSAGDLILVAEVEGRIVGFLRAEIEENPFLENDKIVMIKELYVKPEFRRRGIARRLVDEASKLLRKFDAKILAAEFPTLNVVANDFYKKLGFRSYVSVYIKEA
jgi:ribosomal protein S18 acetylase RimI-like enzyme